MCKVYTSFIDMGSFFLFSTCIVFFYFSLSLSLSVSLSLSLSLSSKNAISRSLSHTHTLTNTPSSFVLFTSYGNVVAIMLIQSNWERKQKMFIQMQKIKVEFGHANFHNFLSCCTSGRKSQLVHHLYYFLELIKMLK